MQFCMIIIESLLNDKKFTRFARWQLFFSLTQDDTMMYFFYSESYDICLLFCNDLLETLAMF